MSAYSSMAMAVIFFKVEKIIIGVHLAVSNDWSCVFQMHIHEPGSWLLTPNFQMDPLI